MSIFRMFREMTGSRDPPPIAPPRQVLRAFGGHMTIEEFRGESVKHSYMAVPENCVVSPSILLKFDADAPTRTQCNKFLSVTRRDDTLRLSSKDTMDKQPNAKKMKTLLETTLGL